MFQITGTIINWMVWNKLITDGSKVPSKVSSVKFSSVCKQALEKMCTQMYIVTPTLQSIIKVLTEQNMKIWRNLGGKKWSAIIVFL